MRERCVTGPPRDENHELLAETAAILRHRGQKIPKRQLMQDDAKKSRKEADQGKRDKPTGLYETTANTPDFPIENTNA